MWTFSIREWFAGIACVAVLCALRGEPYLQAGALGSTMIAWSALVMWRRGASVGRLVVATYGALLLAATGLHWLFFEHIGLSVAG